MLKLSIIQKIFMFKPDNAVNPSTLGDILETWLKILIKTKKVVINKAILPKVQINIWLE